MLPSVLAGVAGVAVTGKGPTLSSLKAVIQHVLLCSSSAHSIFSSLQSLLALLGCATTHGTLGYFRKERGSGAGSPSSPPSASNKDVKTTAFFNATPTD